MFGGDQFWHSAPQNIMTDFLLCFKSKNDHNLGTYLFMCHFQYVFKRRIISFPQFLQVKCKWTEWIVLRAGFVSFPHSNPPSGSSSCIGFCGHMMPCRFKSISAECWKSWQLMPPASAHHLQISMPCSRRAVCPIYVCSCRCVRSAHHNDLAGM